jgi:CubicO group peptidase (beta-lactamase class C family)
MLSEVVDDLISKKIFPGVAITWGSTEDNTESLFFGHLTYDEESLPVNSKTIYDIASLTKVFTATVTLIFITNNKARLEDDVGTILENPTFSGIKIINLLTHTSGLEMSFSKLKKKSAKVIEEVALSTGPKSKPGTEVFYSNQSMYILGKILEKIEGKKLDYVLNKYLINPLNLSSTIFNPPETQAHITAPTEIDDWRNLVQGVVHDEGTFSLGGISGYAGLFSNSADLYKLCLLWLRKGKWGNSKLISESLIDKSLVDNFPDAKCKTEHNWKFGFGWRLYNKENMGNYASEKSLEFSGFTGPTIHIDYEKELIIVIADNRTFPKRSDKEKWHVAHRTIIEDIYQSSKR